MTEVTITLTEEDTIWLYESLMIDAANPKVDTEWKVTSRRVARQIERARNRGKK